MHNPSEQSSELPNRARDDRASLRAFALGLPGAYEDNPWGECVVKVNKKVFVFLGLEPAPDAGLTFSVKLPNSGTDVLSLPFTEPTGYGLGRHGWVTVRLLPGEEAPIDILCDWITESYRAIAPKRLVAQLDAANRPLSDAQNG
jgi:predicted DNA-binding protein (MmcQ/YjbR family)